MSTYLSNVVAGPVITSMCDKKKGSFGNRVDCAGQQMKNNLVTTAQAGGTVLVTAGTLKGLLKATPLQETLAKGTDFIVKGFGKLIKNNNLLDKLNKKLVNNNFVPSGFKAAALVSTVALTALSFIGGKHLFKMGQIDQKYTDKAAIQQQLKS